MAAVALATVPKMTKKRSPMRCEKDTWPALAASRSAHAAASPAATSSFPGLAASTMNGSPRRRSTSAATSRSTPPTPGWLWRPWPARTRTQVWMTECYSNCPAQGYQSLQSTIFKSRIRHAELNSKTVLDPAAKRSKQAAAACGELIRVAIHMLTCQSSSLWSESMLHPGCSLTHNLTQAKSLSLNTMQCLFASPVMIQKLRGSSAAASPCCCSHAAT